MIDIIPKIKHSLEAAIVATTPLRKAQSEEKFEPIKPTYQEETHYRFKDPTPSKILYDDLDETKGPSSLNLI